MVKKQKTFERELPVGYKQVFYLNAKSVKVGIVMNLIALVVLAAVVAVGLAFYRLTDGAPRAIELGYAETLLVMLGFLASMLVYIILHELVHGLFYKLLTHEKLTFGISWSCAFCGVPNICTYRKTAILSAAAPLVIFTLVFLPICAVLFFVHPYLYFLSLFLFGLHLGGCCGDFYLVWLLLFRYKSPYTLIKDTGPEQFIYIPESK